MEAKMSQSSSGAPGWQLEGNAPLAYDTHIVDVFLQDYSRRLVEVAAIKPGQRRFPLQPLRPHNARTRARARATVAGTFVLGSRACPGHPRLCLIKESTRPGMTS